jgi:hypothetical protein
MVCCFCTWERRVAEGKNIAAVPRLQAEAQCVRVPGQYTKGAEMEPAPADTTNGECIARPKPNPQGEAFSWTDSDMNLTMKIRFGTGMNRLPFVCTARIIGVPRH